MLNNKYSLLLPPPVRSTRSRSIHSSWQTRMPKQSYARILESYRGRIRNEVQVWNRPVPLGHSTYLETSKDHAGSASCLRISAELYLSFKEFHDALILRYARIDSNRLTSCDGCDSGESKRFDMNHAPDYKKGGLVTTRHDEIRDELRDLLAHAFSLSRIRCEPIINPVSIVWKCTTQALSLHPTFWMLIAVIYRFAAFRRDWLIL